jgi:hypothetical protein
MDGPDALLKNVIEFFVIGRLGLKFFSIFLTIRRVPTAIRNKEQSPKPNIFGSAAARRLFWPSAAAANRLTPKFLPRRLDGGAAAFFGGQPKTRYIFEF